MPRRRLIWHIFPSHVVVTLAVLLALAFYATSSVSDFQRENIARNLEVRARLMSDRVGHALAEHEDAGLQELALRLGAQASARVTIVLPSGRVVGDSEKDPATMDDHSNRPEVGYALTGSVGRSVRFSQTLRRKLMYVAIPVQDDAGVHAALRCALPLTWIEETLLSSRSETLLSALVIALVGIAASWIVSRRLAQPLERLKLGAERFAQGDFSHHLTVTGSEEIAGLAEAMNQMADQLDQRIRTIDDQRNQQVAVLSSMVEGVLAVDVDECIISMNHSAARMLGAESKSVAGQSIETVVRNTVLQSFVSRALESDKPIEDECVIHGQEEQVVRLHGAVLREASGKSIGAVIVMNDVTRLRRLEQVRQDFVANVSHELRTPITSIKGFVETLLDGDLEDKAQARRFLEIVARQADRLAAILEDLLVLSRAEAGTDQDAIRFERAPVREVLDAVVTLCQHKAANKDIDLTITCAAGLQARMNAPLLEQAIANLVDNAIKYSGAGESVRLTAVSEDVGVLIHVRDNGSGIPSEHLSRLFERFYRVDKARSRSMGGTGLGLSIVKHIANVHGGEARVVSTPGKGSTFSIFLPS